MARLIVKNWREFQHYKDRNPQWIKLHKKFLDDFEFHRLPLASRALAPMIWLLASESNDGSIEYDLAMIAFRVRATPEDIEAAIKPLITAGFLSLEQDASNALADCKSTASLEKRREYTPEKRRGESPALATLEDQTPDSLMQAVATELRISDQWAKVSISEQIRMAMESGERGESIAEAMISAGRTYRNSKEFKFGAWKKFFGSDAWRSNQPRAGPKRKSVLEEAREALNAPLEAST